MSHLDEGQLTLLLDGELTPAERTEAERHLAACADCRRLYQEVRDLAGEADRLVATVEPAPRPVPARPAAPARSRPAWEQWRPLAWAATLVLAAGLGWYSGLGRVALGSPEDRASGVAHESAKAADAAAETLDSRPTATTPTPVPRDSIRRGEVATRQAPLASEPAREDVPAAPGSPAPALAQAQPAAPAPAAGAVDATPGAAAPSGGNATEARRARAPAAPEANRLTASAEVPLVPRDEVTSKQRLEPLGEVVGRTTGPQPSSMEEAVRLLGGSIRLVDGMTPVAVRTIPGRGVPGAEPDAVVIRIVYLDPPGRELWLDQQRPGPIEPEAGARRAPALLPGDTLVSALADGQRRLRWRDPEGFHLSLVGWLSGDSLKALARRVR